MDDIRLIICGGRDFSDWGLMYREYGKFLDEIDDQRERVTLLCGMAEGADTMARLISEDWGIEVEYYYADWERFGNKAGFIRNLKMAETATHMIAFWDGKSSGTAHMIETARASKRIWTRVIMYGEGAEKPKKKTLF